MSNLMRSLSTFDGRSLRSLQQAVERESLRRAAATSLISFTELTYPRYETAHLHRQIAEQLERVEKGEVDRLMLLVPPRHGKSELASRRFPAWYLGRHPERSFISASASFALAEEFGRDVRNLIRSEKYRDIFDTELAEDTQAKGRWMTQAGGSYFATGVGGQLYGRGGHVILVDDPFASMADARSEHIRKEVWQWFTGTLYNRLEKNGAIICIGHRTHTDDLQGRLLAQQAAGGDRWEVVELRALDADGRALWPQKYDEAALARIKANTSSLDWAALYDQAPHPEDGEYFRAEWIVPVDIIPHPSQLRFYGGSDFAVSAGKNDYTVHVVVALDSKLRLYLVDMWRKQATSAEWVEAFCDMVKRWRPALWALEKGQITSGVGPFLRARMRERRAHTGLEEFPVGRRDKAQRAQPIRGWMELRSGLHVPAKASWLSDLKSELLAFPNGRNDDIVDALGLGGQLIDKWAPGGVPKIEPGSFRPLNDYVEPYRRDEPLLSLKVL